jgi:CHAT domain-containing protein
MRRTISILIALVSAIALAGPKPKPARPTPPVQANRPTPDQQKQINDLQKEMYADQAKQLNEPAIKLAKQLIDLEVKIYGPDAREVGYRKQALAGLYQTAGDYTNALAIHKEILASAEKANGPESREVQLALQGVSSTLWGQNRLDEAEPYAQRSLALSKKNDGENSIMYASQLQMYAALLQMHNEFSASERLYEQSLKIHEGLAKSKDDLALLGPIGSLASIYWQTNQLAKAQALYQREIDIVTNSPTANVQQRAATLWGIAAQYHYGGHDDLAKPLTKQVVDIYTAEIARLEKDKPDDPMLPGYLSILGYTYRQADDLPNAAATFKKLVANDEKKTGGISVYSGQLAEIVRAQGHPKEALELYERSSKGMAKLSPMSAHAYDTTMADVLRELGDYKRAEKLLLDYRVYAEKTYGKHHPMYGMISQSLAWVYMSAGDAANAEKNLNESLELAEKDLTNVLRTGTESDHAIYFSKNGYQLDTVVNFGVSFAPKDPGAVKLGLTTLLRRKGRVLDAAAAQMATIRSKLSPEDKKLLDELASARTKLSKMTVAGPSMAAPDDYAKQVAALEDQIQKLEIEVGKKSTAYRVASQAIELAPIQKLIPKDARLVEIVNYQPNDPRAPYRINPVYPPRRFAAYVLGQKGDPQLVDLGEAKPIDDQVQKFRKAVSSPKSTNVSDLGNALFKMTIGKIAPMLGGATEILLAPDGSLNVVPFSALVDDKGKLLLDSYNFTYLTSGRDLLRIAARSKAQGGGVIFADPAFDSTGTTTAPAEGSRGARSMELSGLMWPQLPGTGQEADEVEKTFTGLVDYRGAKATEGALKALHGPKILHLATHGFFLSDAKADKARGPEVNVPGMSQAPPTGSENPLLRSGLALAGANKLQSGDEDGILTSMEATGLDLWGTKLVVLSACDTGNGKVTNGEGVYGLRRALVIAGAESLVMSLWQVDDLATRDLMAGYYTKLKAGHARSTALREIQQEIHAKPKYEHPYYWAAFVAAGDNTPIN